LIFGGDGGTGDCQDGVVGEGGIQTVVEGHEIVEEDGVNNFQGEKMKEGIIEGDKKGSDVRVQKGDVESKKQKKYMKVERKEGMGVLLGSQTKVGVK
jgi:hypothetical protein